MKTILIDEGEFFDPVRLKDCDKNTLIIVKEKEEPTKTIEIDGVKYEAIQPDRPKRSSGMLRYMAATIVLAGDAGMGTGYTRKRPSVNIVEEFKLIQQKKSNLSRNDRDWVVAVFNSQYKKI